MIDTPFVLFYIETMHNLLILGRFQSIFSMTVWNTIGDRYSNVVLSIEMKPHFLMACMKAWMSSNFGNGIIKRTLKVYSLFSTGS